MTRIAVFGLGEAGSLVAGDLAAAGAAVHGYDPAEVATPAGVRRHDTPVAAVARADFVLALTAMADATTALEQALESIPRAAVYADFSSSAPALKRELAARAAQVGLRFVDVALMSTVPGKGLRTPCLAAGSGVGDFVAVFAALGMPVSGVGAAAGDAATRKLLRSVFLKGWAGLAIEAMRAGEEAGLGDWLWEHLAETVATADAAFFRRLVEGTGLHARRRLDEMKATRAMLEDLGVEPLMTRGTVASLEQVLAQGLPPLPDPSRSVAEAGQRDREMS
jgi:3-hydroxyisobutyrate dehydrogenase-like beta-hydroxyacid dehydrogenase